jgi:indole-3-glycerol phosphate synthase
VLDEILAAKRAELALLQESEARATLRRAAFSAPPARDFAGALRRADGLLAVVAEIKRRSPSKGALAPTLEAAPTAEAYEEGGAACLSVLTDGAFFGGSVSDLQEARAAAWRTPVLRKDFTIDPDQVYETRGIGADALLLIIAAVSDDSLLADLANLAFELSLSVVVEVHDPAELDRAMKLQPAIVGVNARDLGSFREDLAVGEDLVAKLPPDVIAVAESAIRVPDDARRMAEAGFDAVLVGEALVRSDDPSGLVRELAAIPTHPRG